MNKLYAYANNRNGVEWAVSEENAPVFRMAASTPIPIEYIIDSVNAYASLRAENKRLRQQLETATALLNKVHEDAQQAPGGYLVCGSTISAIGMELKAREVVDDTRK